MTLDQIITLVIVLCLYMWPLSIIAASDRSRGNEKSYWMLVTIFLSWIGLLLYHFTVLSEKERRKRHRSKMEYEHKKEQALKKRRLMEEKAAAANPPPAIEDTPQENAEQTEQADPRVDSSA